MTTQSPHAAILGLGTAVPSFQIEQANLAKWVAASLGGGRALGRWIERLYESSGIETRYACIPDALHSAEDSRFAPGQPPDVAPTTAERMAIYARESVILGADAAGRALADRAEGAGEDPAAVAASITHLVVVSCTGFFAPGLDLLLARRLGLRPTVERTLIGFMGCAAAFNGLRTAAQILRGQSEARVLVVCVELCSLHIQPGRERVQMVVASLFGDGAAACLVGAPAPGAGDAFEIAGFHTALSPGTETDMIWQIGDHGFVLQVSPDVPAYIGAGAPDALQALMGDAARPRFWAVHPGGRAIVDRLAEVFVLAEHEIEPTRSVLRRYGNLSSPTILFVLDEVRRGLRASGETAATEGVAMGFGPGLVTEMAHLIYTPAPRSQPSPPVNGAGGARLGPVA